MYHVRFVQFQQNKTHTNTHTRCQAVKGQAPKTRSTRYDISAFRQVRYIGISIDRIYRSAFRSIRYIASVFRSMRYIGGSIDTTHRGFNSLRCTLPDTKSRNTKKSCCVGTAIDLVLNKPPTQNTKAGGKTHERNGTSLADG